MDEVYYIGIAASSEEPSTKLIKNARDFLDELSNYINILRIVLGGYWGLMKYIADYADKHGFLTIFILPSYPREEVPRKKNFIPISTGLDYPTRSTILTRTSDLLVALGGRVGSITEIMLAYDYGKPVIVMHDTGYDTDRLYHAFKDTIDSRYLAPIYYVKNGKDAAKKVLELLKLK